MQYRVEVIGSSSSRDSPAVNSISPFSFDGDRTIRGSLRIAIIFTALVPNALCVARAETISLYPAEDTFVSEAHPYQNYGNWHGMAIGRSGVGDLYNARLRFDGIPLRNPIHSATLHLYRTEGAGVFSLGVQCADSAWTESSLTYILPGSTGRWADPVSTYEMEYSTGPLDLNVTAHVREWANGQKENYGFHLTGYPENTLPPNNDRYFGTRESERFIERPRLDITYTPVYGVQLSSCAIGATTPNPGQQISLTGLAGQYHGPTASDSIKVTIGLRDESGAWAGGEPVVVESGFPGRDWQLWSHPGVSITAPAARGTYYVWVRNTPAINDADAILDFKNARPTSANETRDDNWDTALTVAPDYGLRFTSCAIDNTTPYTGQAVNLTGLAGQFHGSSDSEPLKVTIGLRDGLGNWVGDDPQVIATGVPGRNWQPWSHEGVSITAPQTRGTYYVWLRNTPTANSSHAILDFKNARPALADEQHDDRWDTGIVALTQYGVRLDSCVIGETVLNRGQTVDLNGLVGKYHGSNDSEEIKVTIGLRDDTGAWVGGDPQIVKNGVPGRFWRSWRHDGISIAAPTAPGLCHIWVRNTAQATDTQAIQDFKFSRPTAPDEEVNDKWNIPMEVMADYGIRLLACAIDDAMLSPGQTLTLGRLEGQYHTKITSDTLKITIGLRDDSGAWVGGEPRVIKTGAPGRYWQAWSHSGVSIATPPTTGVYYLWVRNMQTSNDWQAIQDFKYARPTWANKERDDKWLSPVSTGTLAQNWSFYR